MALPSHARGVPGCPTRYALTADGDVWSCLHPFPRTLTVQTDNDGTQVVLGDLPAVSATTPTDLGPKPQPSQEPSTNPIFVEAEKNVG